MPEHFEAKKHAYRQTQDGIVISFVCHPSDLASALALAPLGTRYVVAVAEIGDDEKPVENGKLTQAAPSGVCVKGAREGLDTAPQPKDRRPFASLPLSQQAALRCSDPQFQQFMCEQYSGPNPYKPIEENAAIMVREYCGVQSRSDLDKFSDARNKWRSIETHYASWLTDRRYGEARR